LDLLLLLVFVAVMAVFGLVGLVFAVIFAVMIVQSVQRKGRWGINTKLENCPKCGTKVPAFRKPTSLRQALWGGNTCATCGTEMDKWGREIG